MAEGRCSGDARTVPLPLRKPVLTGARWEGPVGFQPPLLSLPEALQRLGSPLGAIFNHIDSIFSSYPNIASRNI